jgi:hypothetical protein
MSHVRYHKLFITYKVDIAYELFITYKVDIANTVDFTYTVDIKLFITYKVDITYHHHNVLLQDNTATYLTAAGQN